MKNFLEHIRSCIFDDRAAGRADQKDLPYCKAAGIQNRHKIEHDHRCYNRRSVDRADGAVEETSVLPVFRFKRAVNCLPDPSQKAENNEVDKVSGNDHVVSPLRALVRDGPAMSEFIRLCAASTSVFFLTLQFFIECAVVFVADSGNGALVNCPLHSAARFFHMVAAIETAQTQVFVKFRIILL